MIKIKKKKKYTKIEIEKTFNLVKGRCINLLD